MKYSYSWIKAKEIIHSLVVPSKNLKHFPNSRELNPKAEAAPASSTGGRPGAATGTKPRLCDKKTHSRVPFLPAAAEDTAHRTFSWEGRTLNMSLLTEGDSRVFSGLLHADLCSLGHRAGGG